MSYFCWLRVFAYVWWCPAQEGSCLIFVGCVCFFACGGVRHRRDHVLFLLVACVCLRVVVSGTGGIMSYFCWLRVFVYVWWCPAHIVLSFGFVFLRLVCPVLPVSLDCPFLNCTFGILSNVYINIRRFSFSLSE